ncbi:hypothetical protein LTR91_001873 [Friedmanniomyces endolithicus]|uniref:Atos-like conserved domain-containing protein n=1 Tax=Friedmanniomyces endolithicus TaxID=329885 RepID=A0AAN6R027_9PEZI|nr:hypothetical protein LTR94_000760 [Friedmanniomyces endolithicus]KAK0777579.1 hypothetical protein LTR75_015897 [Friedmanniomyces endolithicus]KAK0815398.1 hypothetical protein LTR59_000471 [Friedmanniomyces endolithicus]KAK0818186.1 hypothetical protein LTR38_001233 [Friedmanniomyces endolithicus]KAK0856708.1 hypothetical protein LTR03_001045 [Friedmanniomyces endolithicus]
MARYYGYAERRGGRDSQGDCAAADEEQGTGRDSPTVVFNPFYTGRPRTPANDGRFLPMDRQEIIRRIKSRESRPTSPELERTLSGDGSRCISPAPTTSATLTSNERPQSPQNQLYNQSAGMQIERPKSALHRGDFTEEEDSGLSFQRFGEATTEAVGVSPTAPIAPWHPDFSAAVFRQARPERRIPSIPPGLPQTHTPRPRAISHASLSNKFVYRPPTSPLVQASRPDTPEPGERCSSQSPDKSRRHTFSPASLQQFNAAATYPSSARTPPGSRNVPSLRSERTFPYQAHQPRRSMDFQSLPQNPAARRPSFAETALHHAPMVGSYEESILRGRMSTTPSKPLNFVAQIGVLGKGECKSSLQCPPHVSVPFPAVYYSYASTGKPSDQPSLIDIENTLPSAEPSVEKRRQNLQRALSAEGSRASSQARDDECAFDAKARRRHRQKQKRRSASPKAPPGGSFRIPQQGQLQIIIKNPNKTAVKLFLVPYDLSDMEPGQKTFIRQRSYSAGPIIDMPLSSRKNLGTDRPEAALSTSDDPNDRPMLRYLIHLHLCCPSKGRYYLYKSARVVFANRVPDGKENLRNEIQLPEPRYSAYKPVRDSNSNASNATPLLDAARRRSEINPPATPPPHEVPWPQRRFAAQSLPALESYGPRFGSPMPPLPFDVRPLSPLESRPSSRQQMGSDGGMDVDSDRSQGTQSERSAFSPPAPAALRDGADRTGLALGELEDPFTFERDRSRERVAGGRSESLLSRRLRGLVVRRGEEEDGSEDVG